MSYLYGILLSLISFLRINLNFCYYQIPLYDFVCPPPPPYSLLDKLTDFHNVIPLDVTSPFVLFNSRPYLINNIYFVHQYGGHADF
jgi:hypothetical protein